MKDEWQLVKTLGVALCAGLFAWCLLMFEPGSTGNHQGSYFNNACFFIILGLGLTALPRFLRWVFACIYVGWFVVVWVLTAPQAMNTPSLLPSADPLLTILCLLGAAGSIFSILWLAQYTSDSSPEQSPIANRAGRTCSGISK